MSSKCSCVSHRLAQALDLLTQCAVPERALDRETELLHVEGLGDEVVGARADGRDGRLDVRVRGDHDDGHVLPTLDQRFAKRHAPHTRHVDVRDDGAEVFLLEAAERFARGGGHGDLEAPLEELSLEQFTATGFVVDDEDAPIHSLSPGSGSTMYVQHVRRATAESAIPNSHEHDATRVGQHGPDRGPQRQVLGRPDAAIAPEFQDRGPSLRAARHPGVRHRQEGRGAHQP